MICKTDYALQYTGLIYDMKTQGQNDCITV